MVTKRWDKSCKLISNKNICSDYFELILEDNNISAKCLPGQFFMLTVPGVFLRRPFSVHYAQDGKISFLYKVVGKGTKILSEIKSGEIKILGPLGNGYDLNLNENSEPVLIVGGTGIASVYYLAMKLEKKGMLYYGVRTENDLLCMDSFKKLGWKISISTEDGSQGYKGYITDILDKELKSTDTVFACGPTPMLKKVLDITKNKDIKGFVSLEEKMACGIGNCQGCAVKINGQYKMTCKEGPVFKIEEVEL